MKSLANSTQDQTRKSGTRRAVVAGTLAACLALGGVFAYLTATDTVTNNLSLAESLKITVVEPNWDTADADGDGIPDAAQDMVPGQSVAKDPAIRNETGTEAYVIAQVKVPVTTVQTAAEKAEGTDAREQELFTYAVKDGWTENGAAVIAGGYATHTYFCDSTLAGNGTTSSIFDNVTLIDLVDIPSGLSESRATQIDVVGHAIQAQGFDNCADAWTAYQNQNK